ncbi:phylloquinone omega-hydroxylase CYP4F2-like isoform X1 [Mizuhopecten yessoensis]|uniref:phylloquinone omega-hydroxylase CYP4F2-like isoform X1 n=1 Tax=Mizuhopecten yessoensis TaxID=6573 RepID=UPI000B459CEB|nr:phylloquinone omega-hydroxylase CYP4F2-like isoform X1 [Mizuhopecten yessoensis]
MGVTLWLGSGLVAVACCYVLIKLIQLYGSTRKRNAMIERFPGNKSNFLFGNLLEYPGPNEAGLKYQRDMTALYPRVSRGWLGPFIPLIIVNHPETVKAIMKTSEPKGKQIYRLIEPWIGDGLLLSGGSKWRRNRRLLTPAFHFDILRPYQKLNNRTADVFIDKLDRFHLEGDGYFEAFSHVSQYTLDVILQCACSYKTECQSIGDKHPYVRCVTEMLELITDRFFKPWVHNDFIYLLTSDGRRFKRHCDYVHKVAEDIIIKRRESMKSEENSAEKKALDFLDILLTAKDEEGIGLTDIEIRNEVDTFLFEGHDTTSSAISWTLYSLAENPEIQRRIQQEIDEVLQGRDSDDITWDDLSKLTYLTMCVKEGMRLHSPVPVILREITERLEIDGEIVPIGQMVLILIYNTHHNPEVWENSMVFDPERFTPENMEKRDPFAFVPFSAGPRNCIGQHFAMHEMKTILARILRRFDLELDPNHKVEKREAPVMKSQTGIRMKATPRQRVA